MSPYPAVLNHSKPPLIAIERLNVKGCLIDFFIFIKIPFYPRFPLISHQKKKEIERKSGITDDGGNLSEVYRKKNKKELNVQRLYGEQGNIRDKVHGNDLLI